MILYALYYTENHPDRERSFLGIYESEELAKKALLIDLGLEQKRLPEAHISESDYTIDEWDANLIIWIASTNFNTQVFATEVGARTWLQEQINQHREALDQNMSNGSLACSWAWHQNLSKPGETLELKWQRYYEGIQVERGGISGMYYPLKVQD